MTIGEKIQYYRKHLDLSQEELGQKLLVSRQTISQWEKGQTMPTIDNLLRLKEIFGVTVDEILDSENSTTEDAEVVPFEKYSFNFSEEELSRIDKINKRMFMKKPIAFIVLCIAMLILCIFGENSGGVIGFFVGIIYIYIVSFIKAFKKYKKVFAKDMPILLQSTYQYEVFSGFFTLRIIRNGEIIRTSKFCVQDIEKIQDTGEYLILTISGQAFFLRKADLSTESIFYYYIKANPMKTEWYKPAGVWGVLSVVLFILSLVSIFGAILLTSAMTESNNNHLTENIWVFFLFTPVTIASVVLGYILRSKGFAYKKNVVVGIIMTVLLCMFGSIAFLSSEVNNHSNELVVKVEETIGIDIPEYEKINTTDMRKGTSSESERFLCCMSDIYFSDDTVRCFENQIKADEKWMLGVPHSLEEIISPFSSYEMFNYHLIYNMDTNEYNTLPDAQGTYRFLSVFYCDEHNQMKIMEYDIEYK